MAPRLPPEMIRHILHFFSDDKTTLRDCALVSQDWLFEARPFLLKSIKIHHQNAHDRFVSDVLHSDRLRPWLTSIHHLTFGLLVGPIADEAFILDISEHLSNLHTLIWQGFRWLEGRSWHTLRSEVFPAFGKFSHLHHLKIVDSFFASFEELKNVVVACPSLSSLNLSRVSCCQPSPSEEFSSPSPSTSIWPAALSKLSLSTYDIDSQETADDVLQWLYSAPARNPFEEIAIDLCNLAAALPLIAETSLTALGVQMYDPHETLGDDAHVAELRPLFLKLTDIELLRLQVIVNSWDDVACLLGLFASVSTVRRLRLCFESESYLSHEHDAAPDFGNTSAEQLEAALLNVASPCAFCALRAVDFACFLDDADTETLCEQRERLSSWAARTLARLHEECAVEVYTYNGEFVCGPMGLSEHAGGADFPDA